MVATLPTDVADPVERAEAMRASMAGGEAALRGGAGLPAAGPVAPPYPPRCPAWPRGRSSGWRRCPGLPFNLFVSNVPGPPRPLYVAGAKVEGIYPVSAVTDMTGGLNITLFSYDGHLDFGLIACREMVPGRVEPGRLPRGRPGRAARRAPRLGGAAGRVGTVRRSPDCPRPACPVSTGASRPVARGGLLGALHDRGSAGPRRPGGGAGDRVDEGLVQLARRSWPMPGTSSSSEPRTRGRGRPAPGDVHHPVAQPWTTRVGRSSSAGPGCGPAAPGSPTSAGRRPTA